MEKGKGRVMEPKTSGSFWGKGPDGPAARRAGWGGEGLGGPELIALLLECVPMVLSASSPPPAFMLRDDSLEKLV